MSDVMPPPLFDLDDAGALTPPVFEPTGHGVALTPYGRHEDLGPGLWTYPYCGDAHYDAINSNGQRVWIYHACSYREGHDLVNRSKHKCDRCEETW